MNAGEKVSITVAARNPAAERDGERNSALSDATLVYSASSLPEGAVFDSSTHTLSWKNAVNGEYEVVFTVDDGVIPVSRSVTISVL